MQPIFSGNNTYRYKLDLISFFLSLRSQGKELKCCIFVDLVFSMLQFRFLLRGGRGGGGEYTGYNCLSFVIPVL